jgi:hypothetical protein
MNENPNFSFIFLTSVSRYKRTGERKVVSTFKLQTTFVERMFTNPPSVVFGKAPVKTRASFHNSGSSSSLLERASSNDKEERNGNNNANSIVNDGGPKNSLKLTNEDRLRLVQLEIGQKEACKVLKSIYDENCRLANMTLATEYEGGSNDFINGILMLGNLCKRIAIEKNELEKKNKGLKEELEEKERRNQDNLEQLEQVILNLQAENIQASDAMEQEQLKHKQKVLALNKEVYN